MRPFHDLDTHAFKAFYHAAETLNFTQAARRAALTQSGVSQHIAKLETQLGVSLFLRIRKSVRLTEAGKQLKQYVEIYLDQLDRLQENLQRENAALSGRVAYAMPASCLMSPHFPLLLEARRKHCPDIELKVTLCPSDDVFEKLLAGDIDFGFVTKHTGDADICFEPFCPEEYVLIGTDENELRKLTPKKLQASKFLAYPGVEILFGYWQAHHFPQARNLTWDSLRVVGEINDLRGVLEMSRAGMGLTVVPKHCAEAHLSAGRLHGFRGKRPALRNEIYIVTLAGRALPRRVRKILELFDEMKT